MWQWREEANEEKANMKRDDIWSWKRRPGYQLYLPQQYVKLFPRRNDNVQLIMYGIIIPQYYQYFEILL